MANLEIADGIAQLVETVYTENKDDKTYTSTENKKAIENLVQKIDFNNPELLSTYGSDVQREITTLSENIFKNIKKLKYERTAQILKDLKDAVYKSSYDGNILLRLFISKKRIQLMAIRRYEEADSIIKILEKEFDKQRQELIKSSFVYEQMHKMNLECFEKIKVYISAGKIVLEKKKYENEIESKKKVENNMNIADVQRFRDTEETCRLFENKINELELTKQVSIQLMQQINVLQKGDSEIAEKLRVDLVNIIMLWRNQMSLALGIDLSANVMEANNEMILKTQKKLSKNSGQIEGKMEKLIKISSKEIDNKKVNKINAEIIDSIEAVIGINEDYSKKYNDINRKLSDSNEKMSILRANQKNNLLKV